MRRLTALALVLCAGAVSAQPARRPATEPLAHFNHLYATVDAGTARAIKDSRFLADFANFEVRTTTGTQATWTGRYLSGRQTYIEFFGPDDFEVDGRPAPVGAWGIGLSGDAPGVTAALKTRLEAGGHKALTALETRRFGERTVPWFTSITAITEHGDSGDVIKPITVWAMEYVPSYFEQPEAAKEPAEGERDIISRERYQSDVYKQKLVRDVAEARFLVPRQDFARIQPLLQSAGFKISRLGDTVVADGVGTDFRFRLTEGTMGLTQITFVLNAPASRRVEKIGKSTLTVGPDATAVWTFD